MFLSDSDHRESYLRSKWAMHKALKPKSELWGISTWKKTNWRISVLWKTRRMFIWLRNSW